MIEDSLLVKTFATLSHILRAIANCMKYLLDEKRFNNLLSRKLNNNLIETYFYEMKSMSGMDAILSIELFCQKFRSSYLREESSLSKNKDSAFN